MGGGERSKGVVGDEVVMVVVVVVVGSQDEAEEAKYVESWTR